MLLRLVLTLGRMLREVFWFWPQPTQVLERQVGLVLQNFSFALACACGGGWVIAIALLGQPSRFFLQWVLLNTAYTLLSIYVARRAARLPDMRQCAQRLTAAMFGLGCLWGLAAVGVVLRYPTQHLLVFAMVGSAVIAGALGFAAPYLPVYTAFMAPFLAVLWAISLWKYGADVFVALSWGIPIYLVALLYFSANYYRSTLASIHLQFANQHLLTELTEQNRIAQTARQAAEDAVRAKNKFLAAASHDLRQPIHALGLFLDAMDSRSLPPRKQEILGNAVSALDSCREMLEALLDYSRIEAGIVESQPVDFALQPMLFRLLKQFGQEADQRNLVLRLHDTALMAHADPMLVELIVRNFLMNAMRYTERGGVLMAVRKVASLQEVCVEVWDTGIGIAPEHQQEVFREFYQLGNAERDQRQGLGLGLAIVDGLARKMQARVSLRSQPQRGSVFRLHLPWVHVDRAAAPQVKLPVAASHSNLAGIRLLAIDDNTAIRQAIVVILEQQGCDVRVFANIDAALAEAEDFAPHVVVTDYRLQGERTGGDAIRLLRAVLGEELPAIVLTGDTAPERLREAHSIRAELLHKPIASDKLIDSIARGVAARRSASPLVALA